MTVCIAAIAGKSVIGASDRLVTAGDVQFEPNRPKIKALTNSVVVMTAGDAFLQSEILDGVSADVQAAVSADPHEWISVRSVADLYCDRWAEIKRHRAEHAILKPLGLSTETFLQEQSSMDEDMVKSLTNALVEYGLPGTATLVVGVDAKGAHIFVIYDGVPMQADSVGFAAIGIGGRHAESQMMIAQYASDMPVSAGMMLVHLAKSRAEVAPGVGPDTDMFVVGPELGSYANVPDNVLCYLRAQAVKLREEEAKLLDEAQAGMDKFLANLGKQPAVKQEIEPDYGEGWFGCE
jgi:ATP-dependent protease HslVU (ClpYQ) peptidase subunit